MCWDLLPGVGRLNHERRSNSKELYRIFKEMNKNHSDEKERPFDETALVGPER